MDKGQQLVVKLLAEARANELALAGTLKTHLKVTEPGSYRRLLERHLRETEEHARRVDGRLRELNHSENPLHVGYGVVQNVVTLGLAAAKAPVDMLRGRFDRNEKMLRNAMDEAMTEGLEIGSYDAIEHVARSVGDDETATLAASIREDEENMLSGLRSEMPALAEGLVASEVPDSERAPIEPWPGYSSMTVDQIARRLKTASEAEAAAVRAYEARNRNRKTVLEMTA